MFKKLLFSLFSLIFIFSIYNAYAFFNKVQKEYTEGEVFYDNLQIVSENDLNDNIFIFSTSTPNTQISFTVK